jgi:hypothetical protein
MNEQIHDDINTVKENAEIIEILKNKQVIDFLALPKSVAIKVCLDWNEEVNEGKTLVTKTAIDCPIYFWVIHNNAKCHREMVPNTAACPLCGRPVCPDCMNHNVDIISRVTGYLSTVSGWNDSKKQEFEDRNRYNLNVMGKPAQNVNR